MSDSEETHVFCLENKNATGSDEFNAKTIYLHRFKGDGALRLFLADRIGRISAVKRCAYLRLHKELIIAAVLV